MATTANVNKTPQGTSLPLFSRYFDAGSKGVNQFSQDLAKIEAPFCFPPEPIISMVLGYLKVQRKFCIVLVPEVNALWVNLLRVKILLWWQNALIIEHLQLLTQQGRECLSYFIMLYLYFNLCI